MSLAPHFSYHREVTRDAARTALASSEWSWKHRRGLARFDGPQVMAIVNMTPDSFSDGGRFVIEGAEPAVSVAKRQCARWLEAGAGILDVGGESTRPGAEAVGGEAEIRRVCPLIAALRADASFDAALLSVDTRHAEVARAAFEAGADLVNDISGLADPQMAEVVAEFGGGLVIGHMRGTPKTMQRAIHFDDLFGEVEAELRRSIARAREAGVEAEAILVDPCVGFGKTAEQSAALVAASHRLEAACERPVLIGASRKSFLPALAGELSEDRSLASVAAALCALEHGAKVVRVHDVEATAEAVRVRQAIEGQWRRFSDGGAGAAGREVPAR